ncbi:uncharacterized protein LY89DRAFT_732688 [Mollisia scopiformis]|uniref:Uncharacterized protein n=1 Tax=Mollisia scopiformis TaxID=149040 RepID=A0A194XCV9_MOLSC|nr:uncharacterized protein LY89DRAFT_732688 [Mollisia scopiformis]KUJ17986.1 hypothetical protein LY89DRAFT_732688 [Mollisia scopiformis]
MKFTTLTGLFALLTTAIANPISSELTTNLAKRATEGIHLVNCGNNVYSVVVYCPNDGDCNHDPGAGNGCDHPNGGTFTWEGSQQNCKFDTGTTLTWNIESNAQSQPNFAQVGTGSNGFHNFNIFKDDKHTMFTDGNKNQCNSIYYALDVS